MKTPADFFDEVISMYYANGNLILTYIDKNIWSAIQTQLISLDKLYRMPLSFKIKLDRAWIFQIEKKFEFVTHFQSNISCCLILIGFKIGK